MADKRYVWWDIGMVVAAGIFIAIVVVFNGTGTLVPALAIYLVALIAWALVAEAAAMRLANESRTGAETTRTHNGPEPIAH